MKDPAHLVMNGVEEVEPRACKEGRDCIWPGTRVRRLQREPNLADGSSRVKVAESRRQQPSARDLHLAPLHCAATVSHGSPRGVVRLSGWVELRWWALDAMP